VKNHKIANNTTTSIAREKNKHRFEILRILEIFDACLTKFKNNQILLNKISHRFLLTTKLYTGQKIIIEIMLINTEYSDLIDKVSIQMYAETRRSI